MVKLGIIGLGNMGKNHLRVSLEQQGYFELVGFYDCSEKVRKDIEEKYGVKGYASIDELIENVEACIVAVPSSLHKEIGLKLSKKKIHTLMEKPICMNLEEAEELRKAYDKDTIFMVGHVERYNPAVTELSKVLKNEDIISIEMHRCSPYDPRIFDASVIMDLMIHDADILINELCPEKIKNLVAFGNHFMSPQKMDYVQSLIRFENNTIASIVASRSTEDKIRTININTKNGYINADLLNKKLTITRRTNCSFKEDCNYKQDSIVETIFLPFVEPLKAEHTEFYNSIVNKSIPRTNMDSSIKTLELCEQVEKLCEEVK